MYTLTSKELREIDRNIKKNKAKEAKILKIGGFGALLDYRVKGIDITKKIKNERKSKK